MNVKQIKVGHMANFSYLLYTKEGGEAVVIDPSFDESKTVDIAKKLKLNITKIIFTHAHPDHMNSALELRKKTGASIMVHEKEKPILFRNFASQIDEFIKGEPEIKIGDETLKVILTPGHSPGGICLLVDNMLFTGDTLFVGACGRCDLPGSDCTELQKNLRKLMTLPDDTVIYPGHDYGPTTTSTIGREKKSNPFLEE